MLVECQYSVLAQTLPALEHLVLMDEEFSMNTGVILNSLAESAQGEWLAPLADDDLFLPQHLQRLLAYSDDADIVHSKCIVLGRGNWEPNYTTEIPAVALIRKSLWDDVRWSKKTRAEDGDFYDRARQAGAHFVFVPETTWIYRFHGANKSLISDRKSFREEFGEVRDRVRQ